MKVFFVSKCRKNARKITEGILNKYAERAGFETWTAEITEDGLGVLRSELSSKATKNTAVRCFAVIGKKLQPKWIVGRRDIFDTNGKDSVAKIPKTRAVQDESSWLFLPVISSLSAIAALLHDLGKLSLRFQKKLTEEKISGDPIRHEYISCMLLRLFLDKTGAETDKQWLEMLPDIDIPSLFEELKTRIFTDKGTLKPFNPFLDVSHLPVFLSVCWLIVSHHRLSYSKANIPESLGLERSIDWSSMGLYMYSGAGYENTFESTSAAKECVTLSGLFESEKWRRAISKHSERLATQAGQFSFLFEKPDYTTLTLSLMCLVYGDHTFSAKDCRNESNKAPYANTIKENDRNFLNQTLEQHLCGVCKETLACVHFLPKFENLDKAYDIEWLDSRSTGRFAWQEKAFETIKGLKKKTGGGIFVVNMAGTGTGKTLANAKILHALCGEGIRGTVTLGLRTLTKQTGDEYRKRMGVFEDDLYISMGSREYQELDEDADDEDNNPGPLFEQDGFDFQNRKKENPSLFDRKSDTSKFLCTPVLVCTIDQMIKAIESTSGGKGVIPMARMMSSDIVIDEVDDFTDGALVSIGRLVYLTASMGRNVIISSATITPELSLGLKYFYDRGYTEYARHHGKANKTSAVIVDEFNTKEFTGKDAYYAFCREHVDIISKLPHCRKAEIADVPITGDEKTDIANYYETVYQSILKLHKRHCKVVDGKRVSFGLVRFATIEDVVAFVKDCLNKKKDARIVPLVYHSRFPLVIRHEIESYLDKILNRKDPEAIYKDPIIAKHINNADKDVIFVVVASPIEELGRDHDFDWGVTEPSSYRALIQIIGRILRHRLFEPAEANVIIIQYPLRYIKKRKGPCFCRPGFESGEDMLSSHDMKNLVDVGILLEGVTSAPRVLPVEDIKEPFAILEHNVIRKLLDPNNINAGRVTGYIQGYFLTALPKRKARLRDNTQNIRLVYKRIGHSSRRFVAGSGPEKGTPIEESQNIHHDDFEMFNPWLDLDYDRMIEEMSQKTGKSKKRFENKYSILDIPDNSHTDRKQRNFYFHEQLGMFDRE